MTCVAGQTSDQTCRKESFSGYIFVLIPENTNSKISVRYLSNYRQSVTYPGDSLKNEVGRLIYQLDRSISFRGCV